MNQSELENKNSQQDIGNNDSQQNIIGKKKAQRSTSKKPVQDDADKKTRRTSRVKKQDESSQASIAKPSATSKKPSDSDQSASSNQRTAEASKLDEAEQGAKNNQPERTTYQKVKPPLFVDLIEKLKGRKDFDDKKYSPESHNCHFIRYSFVNKKDKVSIVYDTKAEMLTITAFKNAIIIIDDIFGVLASKYEKKMPKEHKQTDVVLKPELETDSPKKQTKQKKRKKTGLAEVLNTYASEDRVFESSSENYYINYNHQDILKSRTRLVERAEVFEPNHQIPAQKPSLINRQEIQIQAETPKSQSQVQQLDNRRSNPIQSQSKNAAQSKSQNQNQVQNQNQSSAPSQNQKSSQNKNQHPNLDDAKQRQQNSSQNSNKDIVRLDTEYKDGYSVKKIKQDMAKAILTQLENTAGLKLQNMGTVKSTAGDITTYSIEDSKRSKVYLRHISKKNMLQLQGKRSELFAEIQILISKDTQSKSAEVVGDKQQKSTYKEVKKALPTAFDYLSEQSKIDFTIGLIDICNEEVKLSDYSVLLVPPYRGLERLLYDLQKAKGIEVKMIGQAYEKDGGSYTLKSGYRKKIDSIVYNEALSALYTEYFEKRNFYAHSNNTDEYSARVISERSQARAIFENLVSLINYNCKKLNEIGFTIK